MMSLTSDSMSNFPTVNVSAEPTSSPSAATTHTSEPPMTESPRPSPNGTLRPAVRILQSPSTLVAPLTSRYPFLFLIPLM
jgi:hypothetical protein